VSRSHVPGLRVSFVLVWTGHVDTREVASSVEASSLRSTVDVHLNAFVHVCIQARTRLS